MQDQNPYTLFGLTFGISSVAGLAALLRSKQELTTRLVVSAFLNAGLFGTGVAMIWYENYGGKAHPWFMLGISLLAGLGGTTLLDFCLRAVGEMLRAYTKRLADSLPAPEIPSSLPLSNQLPARKPEDKP